MTTREAVIKKLREQQLYLAKEYGVRRIGVFGSYAKKTATPSSDVDLVVEFDRPIGFKFMDLGDYLERVLGRKVDILTPAGIQGIRSERVARDIEESIEYV